MLYKIGVCACVCVREREREREKERGVSTWESSNRFLKDIKLIEASSIVVGGH